MARDRIYGTDTPSCKWIREHPELPSASPDIGFVLTDSDVVIHRYKTCHDSIGTRELQVIMDIETKTYGGIPSSSQLDTLYKKDLFEGWKRTWNNEVIRYFGHFVWILSDTHPENSTWMTWGMFVNHRNFRRYAITMPKLLQILRFDIHPRTFNKNPFRRHHKTQSWIEMSRAPLGFICEKKSIKRS